MPVTVFLNGAFVDPAAATVGAFDAGFQHGVGLFETLIGGFRDGDGGDTVFAFRLEDHLERLAQSASELGLVSQLGRAALAEAVLETIRRSELDRARVRLTISGGNLNMLSPDASRQHEPTVMIVAQPATRYPEEMFTRGVSVTIADLRVNPLDATAGHKTLNYWARLRELQAAAGKRAGEALVFQVSNYLAGGCVSNALLFKDGELLTPIARGEETEAASSSTSGAVLPSPVLPGIVREWALEWAARQRIKIRRRMISIDDVLGATELVLTNSSWGILPVVRVESREIGNGAPGEIAAGMRRDYARAVDAGEGV